MPGKGDYLIAHRMENLLPSDLNHPVLWEGSAINNRPCIGNSPPPDISTLEPKTQLMQTTIGS